MAARAVRINPVWHEAVALRDLTPAEQAQMAADPSLSTPGVPTMAQDVSDHDCP